MHSVSMAFVVHARLSSPPRARSALRVEAEMTAMPTASMKSATSSTPVRAPGSRAPARRPISRRALSRASAICSLAMRRFSRSLGP